MNDLEKEGYYEVAEWKKSKDGESVSLTRRDVPIQDSFTGPHEDFSNNVELLLFQKESLNKTPELTKYMEKIIQ